MEEEQPEEVALLVSASGLEAGAQLSAQVVWGQPSGKVEARADLPQARMPDLHQALPLLLDALLEAISRGRPSRLAAT